jgi:hypothetical protein
MKLMPHHATGLPGATTQLLKRKSKSFIFFDFLLHGQGFLTIYFLAQRLADQIHVEDHVQNQPNGDFTEFSGKVRTFRPLILCR